MLNKYEGLFIFESADEDATKVLLDKVQKEIEAVGGQIETVQKMGHRPLARTTTKRTAGFYANYIFEAPPQAIKALDAKMHLENGVFRWQFTRAALGSNPDKVENIETAAVSD